MPPPPTVLYSPYETDQPPDGNAAMNLGNKYAKSYSSANPPPRPGQSDGKKGGADKAPAAVPSFMDDLGMDKARAAKARP